MTIGGRFPDEASNSSTPFIQTNPGSELTAAIEYVAARKVLLDTLVLLQEHLPSLILVGAQAVYERTGRSTFGGAQYTTDSDLLLDAEILAAAADH